MPNRPTTPARSFEGVAFAFGAFFLWGILPIYWKWLKVIAPFAILSHRILWSIVFLGLMVSYRKSWSKLRSQFGNARAFPRLVVGTCLISFNWGLYIWAVNTGHVLETSLGYFLNPVFSILLGRIFFDERLKRWQKVSVFICVLAIANLIWHHGKLPWIAIGLALTFGSYGLVKKKGAGTDAMSALFCETLLLAPASLIYLWAYPIGFTVQPPHIQFLLIGAGVVTALPLYFFGEAAARLKLSSLGLFQYMAPSLQFCCAIFVFHEPLSNVTLLSFVLVWIAIALFTWDNLRRR